MKTFSFGMKSGQIAQLGYGVTDIDRAIDIYINQLHIGPWRYKPRFMSSGGNSVFRGAPSSPGERAMAMAFAGNYFIELIQQFSGGGSCVKEHGDQYGYGLNHYGIFCDMDGEFDRKKAELEAFGYEEAFSGITTTGSRAIYMGPKKREDVDTLAFNLGVGYIEMVELTEDDEAMWYKIYTSAQNWDGKTKYIDMK